MGFLDYKKDEKKGKVLQFIKPYILDLLLNCTENPKFIIKLLKKKTNL